MRKMRSPKDYWSIKESSPQCIVYLESFEKVGVGVVDAYVDFRLEKDMSSFGRVMAFQSNKATFIELRYLRITKRLRRGCYYNLNLELLKNYQLERVENSLVIGARIDLSKMQAPRNDDEEILQRHEALDATELSMRSVPEKSAVFVQPSDDLKLFVKNVNQANWNELRSGDSVKLVYDVGAELHASRREVEQIFNSRRSDLSQSKPILVISHWDIDHIHCLKYLDTQEIKSCFSKIVCADKLKSITSRAVLAEFLVALGAENVFCLPVPKRTNGVAMHHWRTEGVVSIYRAEQSSSINYCGLVLFVRGSNRSANFTGDCRLKQAKDVYDQEVAKGVDTNQHILIAPHHGGDYGAKYRQYSKPCDIIEISVGKGNTYGHPDKRMLDYLQSLGSVYQTMYVGDILENI